ncbi:MAG: methylase, partial [Bacteroidales bacterium]|nr:methylase [Bacteroidales bacterium]
MQQNQLSKAAARFAQKWSRRGYEKGESQVFWIELLHDVLGVENPTDFISFENQVKLSNTSFIDAYIATTRVLIEQKSIDKDLRKAIPQSDGSMLTPFQQAKKYVVEMPVSKHLRWVITCNFKSFFVYDMENPQSEPEIILLENLEKEYYRLQFIVEQGNEHLKKEMEVSLKAGVIIGKIYDEFLKQYINPEDPQTLKSLNILCVRLVFCLYAEDAGLFGEKRCMFHDYLSQFKPGRGEMRKALIELFDVLNTPVEERDPYLDDSLRAFPYCNGGLFAEKDIEIPRFNDELAELVLKHASDDFDWSQISPTIFGAVFESTLNPE